MIIILINIHIPNQPDPGPWKCQILYAKKTFWVKGGELCRQSMVFYQITLRPLPHMSILEI